MLPRLLFLILAACVVLSCGGREQLSKEELNRYVLDVNNGLRKAIEKQGVTLEMIYRPKDLIIAQDAGLDDPKQWEETEKRLDSLDYFIFRLSRKGEEIENNYAGDPAKYTEVVNYLSDGIAQNITMQVAGQEFSPENFLFAPSFGSSDASSMLVVFKSNVKEARGTISIVFDDSVFGTGRTEFNFEAQAINESPRLRR